MAQPEPVAEHRTRPRHTAIVLVSVVDRRILPALRFVSVLPDTEVRAPGGGTHFCTAAAPVASLNFSSRCLG